MTNNKGGSGNRQTLFNWPAGARTDERDIQPEEPMSEFYRKLPRRLDVRKLHVPAKILKYSTVL